MRKIGVFASFFLVLLFIVTACNPFDTAVSSTATPPATFQPAQSATVVAIPTVAPTIAASESGIVPDVDFAGISFVLPVSVTTDVADVSFVPAIASTEETNFWEVIPELTVFTLSGNESVATRQVSQILIYPVADFGLEPEYANVFTNLFELLETRPEYIYNNIPSLPLTTDAQIVKSHIHYLDFQNGQGIRFITQYAPYAGLVTNQDLVYTFQGLTDDNQYYVAATIPLNTAILPQNETVTPGDEEDFAANFGNYLANTQIQLSAQTINGFTPNLGALDTLFSSLNVAFDPTAIE